MRVAWVLAATTACGFRHGELPRDASVVVGDNGRAADAPPDVAIDARELRACDPSETSLVACYPFEGSTQDVSGNALHASMTNVAFATGKRGMALDSNATSATDVADSQLLDLSAVTIQAWIHPSELPATGLRAGIVDVEGQFGLFLHELGRLQCTMINGASMQIAANIPAGAWTHVACTYGAGTTTMFVNGMQQFQAAGGGTLATNGVTGMTIGGNNPPGSGQRLIGLIDEIRIYNVARAAADICTDAACD